MPCDIPLLDGEMIRYTDERTTGTLPTFIATPGDPRYREFRSYREIGITLFKIPEYLRAISKHSLEITLRMRVINADHRLDHLLMLIFSP